MRNHSKFIFCFAILSLLMAAGCAEATDEPGANTDTNTDTLECGPNSTLHRGLGAGAEDHCDCNPGYQLYDGECISDDSPEFNTEPPKNENNEPPKNENNNGTTEEGVLPLSCWAASGTECDPRNGEGCDIAAGETCDLASTPDGALSIRCWPGPNTQGLGQSCSSSSGPFCSVGMHCISSGSCNIFCCGDNECTNGDKCSPIATANGTPGVCSNETAPTPACGQAGASCQTASQCCSNDCHAGHCH